MIPGEYRLEPGEIALNAGRPTLVVTVRNTGDRPIQVGSHYHFAETNAALDFDRSAAHGHRLNIAAGTAVRFEPGQSRTVELVALSGARVVYGFRQQVMGPLEGSGGAAAVRGGARAARHGKVRTVGQAASAATPPKASKGAATSKVRKGTGTSKVGKDTGTTRGTGATKGTRAPGAPSATRASARTARTNTTKARG